MDRYSQYYGKTLKLKNKHVQEYFSMQFCKANDSLDLLQREVFIVRNMSVTEDKADNVGMQCSNLAL